MFIYSQHPLSSAESREKQLYITYFKEDKAAAAPVLDRLRARGTDFSLREREQIFCQTDDYVSKVTQLIRDCRVGVVMLSKATFAPENTSLQQLLWYEVGVMMTTGVRIILYFLDIQKSERNSYLATTPVRQIQGTDNIDDLVQLLDDLQVPEKIFYDDLELNRYASRRISYFKLTSLFNIYKSDFEAIYNEVREDDEDDDLSMQDLLTEFLSEVKCGCTVVRFNNYPSLGIEVTPYLPEVKTIIRDYPVKQNYSRPVLINSDTSPDIYATLQGEFILPVHSLLGVTFKPFMSVKRSSRFSAKQLETILLHNSGSTDREKLDFVHFKSQGENRVYFLLEIDTTPADGIEGYGQTLNHLWPV